MPVEIRQLTPGDVELMNALLRTFGEAFNDMATYTGNRPGADYLNRLLGGDSFIALAALKGDEVVGGIAAYELKKFEQERSEIYIYDLAVLSTERRKGIATTLIERLKDIAAARGAYVMFVQADTSIEDQPAVALYSKLGTRENVVHFDIPVEAETPCPECGAVVGGGRSGCQQMFDEVLAREFSDSRYAREHRLTVGAYSLQHPEEYMRSAKSYAAHLVNIYAALEEDADVYAYRSIGQWLSGRRRPTRGDAPGPMQRGSLTITHVHRAGNPDEHLGRVREWVASVWQAWRDYHDVAREWFMSATRDGQRKQ